MDQFEYVVALAAVITGLGLSDMAVSLHRLVKRRNRVRWDWLPVALALYSSLVLMRLWYQLWSVRELDFVSDLPFVTVQVVQTLVLVLVVSAALPDEDDFRLRRIDLQAYYVRHARYIWTTYLVFLLMWAGTGAFFYTWGTGGMDWLLQPRFHLYFMPPIVLTVAALLGGRRVQAVALILLITHELLFTSDFFGVARLIA